MLRNIIISLYIPTILFSQNLLFDMNKKIPLSTLKEQLPKNIIISDDEIQKEYSKKLFFANQYIKNISENDKNIIKNIITDSLYKLQIEKIFKQETINIDENITYSYYLANKNKYLIKPTVDLYILMFSKKEDAEKYSIETDKPKPISKNQYHNYQINSLSPNYLLFVKDAKPLELSNVFKNNNMYIRVYYNNKRNKHYIKFEEVKENIKRYLFNQKKLEILDKIYEKK